MHIMQEPLTEAEIEDLISELLEVESKVLQFITSHNATKCILHNTHFLSLSRSFSRRVLATNCLLLVKIKMDPHIILLITFLKETWRN
jgi:hypothetical protein